MSKTKKTPVFTTRTKGEEKHGSGRSSLTRLMALFLAALMLLGAAAMTVFYFTGMQQTARPMPDEYGITDAHDGDVIC